MGKSLEGSRQPEGTAGVATTSGLVVEACLGPLAGEPKVFASRPAGRITEVRVLAPYFYR
jgi:hypothetical protein